MVLSELSPRWVAFRESEIRFPFESGPAISKRRPDIQRPDVQIESAFSTRTGIRRA